MHGSPQEWYHPPGCQSFKQESQRLLKNVMLISSVDSKSFMGPADRSMFDVQGFTRFDIVYPTANHSIKSHTRLLKIGMLVSLVDSAIFWWGPWCMSTFYMWGFIRHNTFYCFQLLLTSSRVLRAAAISCLSAAYSCLHLPRRHVPWQRTECRLPIHSSAASILLCAIIVSSSAYLLYITAKLPYLLEALLFYFLLPL